MSEELIERLRAKKRANGMESTKPGVIAMKYEDDPLTTEAADALQSLQAENFMLAAGACINPGQHALVGDEHGNSICTAYEALQAAERALADAEAENARLTALVHQLGENAATAAREDASVKAWRAVQSITPEIARQEPQAIAEMIAHLRGVQGGAA
jgi:hypothetical protein